MVASLKWYDSHVCMCTLVYTLLCILPLMTAIDSDDDCILSQALDMAKYNKNCEIYSGDDASLSQALDLAIEPSF